MLFPGQGISPGLGPGTGTGTGWGGGVRAQDASKLFSSFSGGRGTEETSGMPGLRGSGQFRVLISFRATAVREGFSSALSQDFWLPVRSWRGRSIGGGWQRRGVWGCGMGGDKTSRFCERHPSGLKKKKKKKPASTPLLSEPRASSFALAPACSPAPPRFCVQVGSDRGEGSAHDVSGLF